MADFEPGGGGGGNSNYELSQAAWDSLASLGVDPAAEGYVLAGSQTPVPRPYQPTQEDLTSYANSPKGPAGVLPSTGKPAPTRTYTQIVNGRLLTIDADSNIVISDQPAPSTSVPRTAPTSYGTGPAGPTWYEQQQIRLEEQRLADARASSATQQAEIKRQADASAIEKFNSDFRAFQEKSPYGAQYGPTYFSPAGSVFAQRAPESSVLKDAFASSGQPDPWQSSFGTPAGYTGTSYSNAQHPGLTDYGAPIVQPIPNSSDSANQTGVHPDLMNVISTHPDANKFALSLPGVKDAVINQMLGSQPTSPAPIVPAQGGQ